MAVSVNATGTFSFFGGGTSDSYTGITVASGSNSALVVACVWDQANIVTPTATWDSGGTNQAMTLLASTQGSVGSGLAAVFGLRAPTTGNKTLALSWTNSSELYINAIAFDDVDQTSDATAFPTAGRTTNSGATSPSTITITSGANNYCVVSTLLSNGLHRTAFSDSELFYSTAGVDNGESNYSVGSSSKTLTLTLDANNQWANAGIDIAASGGVVAIPNKIYQANFAVKRAAHY